MIKKISFSEEALEKLKIGVNIVGDTVGQTLGAKGRNVIIDKGIFPPLITNDGVTIAKDIELEDRFEHMGAALIKEAASNTNEVAGDGTTTATVLAQSMVNEGLKNIAAGANPMILKKGMEAATKEVIEKLREMKKEVKDSDVESIATISSGDAEVGKTIAEVMKKVGTDGVVTVQEGSKIGLYPEVADGMQFDSGMINPYMFTDGVRIEAVHEDAYILVTDYKITSADVIGPVLDRMVKENGIRKLVIIAEDVDGIALRMLLENHMKDIFKSVAVRAPGYGDRRKDYLEDIAIATGANYINQTMGKKLEEVTIADMGRTDKVIVTRDSTTIVGSRGTEKRIKDRLNQIRNQIDGLGVDKEYDKEKLKERYAKLSGGIGVIKVGAPTEVEMKERKYRIEDALNATKAATDPIDGGILPGGGAALAKVKLSVPKNVDTDFITGYIIVQRACEEPLRRIVKNAGNKPDVVVDQVQGSKESFGWNALTGECVDMLEAGIIDPLKVTITAFSNASSVAQMLLTTGAIIIEKPNEKN